MIWILLVTLILAVVIWKYFLDDDNPLDKLPGPPKKPIIGAAFHFIGLTQREIFVTLRNYMKIYGDRYVIKVFNRRLLHIHTPEDIEIVLSHSKNIKKNKSYRFLEPWLGTGLLLSSGEKWHRRRKILTPAFHFNVLKNFSEVMEEKSRNLVQLLKGTQGKYIDLKPVVSDFTLYTICETAMGTQLDSDKSAAKIEYKNAVVNIGQVFLQRVTHVWLHIELIFRLSEIGKRFQEYLVKVHTFADNVIIERKNLLSQKKSEKLEDLGMKRRLAFLDLLLQSESRGEIDLEGIREEVNTFMFEGHDTSAMAITYGLMLLADHEEVQDGIYEECRKISGDTDRLFTVSDLADLKYLEAVVKEILRLYPSVPIIGREISEDFKLGDLLVKKGAEILVHVYDLHRREELYPDPESFRPERFLDSRPKHPFAFVPFSAGPRNCIGQKFAMLEMKYVISEICRNFRVLPKVKGARPDFIADIVLRSIDPVYVAFETR